MGAFSDVIGTLRNTFRIGKATFDSAALTALRTLALPDTAGTVALTSDVMKNAIINGAMEIWQRGTSFSSIASAAFSADRWQYLKAGAVVHDATRSTDVPTFAQSGNVFSYSLKLDITTGDASIAAADYCLVQQSIEGYIWARYAQRPLTLSFWLRSTVTGTYCIFVRNAGSDRSFVKEFTVSSANTWEKKVITVSASPSAGTWNYLDGVGAFVGIALACGSTFHGTNDSWTTGNFLATSGQVNAVTASANAYITGLQLERGAPAAPILEDRAYPDELARCQRYYQTITANARFNATTAENMEVPLTFQTTMRATPTATIVSGGARNNLAATFPQVFTTINGGRFLILSAGAGDTYAVMDTVNLSAEL